MCVAQKPKDKTDIVFVPVEIINDQTKLLYYHVIQSGTLHLVRELTLK